MRSATSSILGDKLHLLNGGTLEIDSPRPYSSVADGLLQDLGVDPVALSKACDRDELYPSLGLSRAIFFDRETFGEDRLVSGVPVRPQKAGSWHSFLARTPLSPTVRRDIERIETGPIDYMPGLRSEQKKDHLSRISYRDYLLKIAHSPEPGGGYWWLYRGALARPTDPGANGKDAMPAGPFGA
jgi:spermidine dehydrogenase